MAIIIVAAIIFGFAFFCGVIAYMVVQTVAYQKWKRSRDIKGWYKTWQR